MILIKNTKLVEASVNNFVQSYKKSVAKSWQLVLALVAAQDKQMPRTSF